MRTHGSSGEPIEIAVEAAAFAGAFEMAVGDVIVRYRSDADVVYIVPQYAEGPDPERQNSMTR